MTLPPQYPSGIVDYNKLRFVTPGAIDTDDVQTFAVQIPRDFTRYFFGAFSLLQDVNSWRKVGALSEEDLVDIANNEVFFVPICEAVADCISNDAAVQNALAQQMVQNPIGAPGQPVSNPDSPINAPSYNPTCDKDVLWAQCEQLVGRVHEALLTTLNNLEVATNAFELIDALGNSIPAFSAFYDALGADGWLDLIDYYQEAAIEQYESQATVTYREQLACDIFCACQSDCSITPNRLFDVMADRTAGYISTPVSSLIDVVEVAFGLSLNTSIVADATFWLAFGSLKLGSVLLPAEIGAGIDLIMRLAVNDANDDHTLLCNCIAGTWQQSFGGASNAWADASSYITDGNIDAVNNYLEALTSGGDVKAVLTFPASLFTSARCDEILITYEQTRNASTADLTVITPRFSQQFDNETGIKTRTVSISPDVDNEQLQVVLDVGLSSFSPPPVIRSIRLRGTGSNPF